MACSLRILFLSGFLVFFPITCFGQHVGTNLAQVKLDTLSASDCRQVTIPISTTIGVPLYISSIAGPSLSQYFLDGFEVDLEGNFYFLGGEDKAVLAKFDTNGHLVFRRVMGSKPSDQPGYSGMRLYDHRLYTFEVMWTEEGNYRPFSNMAILDAQTGSLIREWTNFLPSRSVVQVTYCDTVFVMRLETPLQDLQQAVQNRLPISTKYLRVSLDGRELGTADNEYNLPQEQYPSRYEGTLPPGYSSYVGHVGLDLLFVRWSHGVGNESWHSFWLENDKAFVAAKHRITENLIGDDLILLSDGNPNNSWLLRNACLYCVRALTDGRVVITQIPMSILFPEIPILQMGVLTSRLSRVALLPAHRQSR